MEKDIEGGIMIDPKEIDKLDHLFKKVQEWNKKKDVDDHKMDRGKQLAVDFFEEAKRIFHALTPHEKSGLEKNVGVFLTELETTDLMSKIYVKRTYEGHYAIEPPVEGRLEIGNFDVEEIGLAIIEQFTALSKKVPQR